MACYSIIPLCNCFIQTITINLSEQNVLNKLLSQVYSINLKHKNKAIVVCHMASVKTTAEYKYAGKLLEENKNNNRLAQ